MNAKKKKDKKKKGKGSLQDTKMQYFVYHAFGNYNNNFGKWSLGRICTIVPIYPVLFVLLFKCCNIIYDN